MIEHIKELIEFIQRANSRKMNERVRGLNAKCLQLYKKVSESEQPSDKVLSQAIYNRSPNSAYYNLRARLHDDLMEIILARYKSQGDPKQSSEEMRDYCIGQTAAIRLLQTKGLIKNVIALSKRILKISLSYEFNDINTDILKIILVYYGVAHRDRKQFEHYKTIYHTCERNRIEEDQLQTLYYDMYSQMQKFESAISKKELNQVIDMSYLLNCTSSPDSTYKSKYFAYNLMCLYHLLLHEYRELITVAEQAFDDLIALRGHSRRLVQVFLQFKVTAQIKLNERKDVYKTFDQIEGMLTVKSNAFYTVGIYKALLLIHDEKYAQALERIDLLKNTKNINKIATGITEYIDLIQGYLVCLHRADEYETDLEPKFRIFKFLNEIPTYQKDKRGVHITILILHILFLLLNRKEGEIIDRVDALRLYSYRYLRKNQTFRSNCFIKMLIEMTRADFHPIRTVRYTKDLRSKLDTTPVQLSEQPLEVEIVPYETLWDVVIRILERNNK